MFRNSFGRLLEDKVVKHFVDNDQLTLVEDLERVGTAGVEVEIREDGRVGTIAPENYARSDRNLSDFLTKVLGNL